jgi:predicted permease
MISLRWLLGAMEWEMLLHMRLWFARWDVRFFGNLRFGLRQLRRNLSFSTTAILTLALGIGATTAIFSLVDTVLLKPLPFPEPDRLVWITQHDHSIGPTVPEPLSYPDYFDWRAQNRTLAGLASYKGGSLTLTEMGPAQQLNSQTVSSNFLQVLGVAPFLGRDFLPDEEQAGNRAVMLSFAFWQSRFGSDSGIAGRTIVLDGETYQVAGVMPRSFQFPYTLTPPDVWTSLAASAEGPTPATLQRGNDSLRAIGRLKPGVTVEQAAADLSAIARQIAAQYPDSNKWYLSAGVTLESREITGDTRPALEVLFAAVSLVLLIACVNVAGLLLARGARRAGELALRGALGASRAELIRQLLTESLLLSLCGGAAGLALAKGMLAGAVVLAPKSIPRLDRVSIDPWVLAFAAGLSILTGLLFGMLPAMRASRLRPALVLREGRALVSAGSRHRLQSWLVIGETALSLVLLVGAGLLLRSFAATLRSDPGFDPHGVLTARFSMPETEYSRDQQIQAVEQLLPRLAALPGVTSASAGWPMPMSASFATISFTVEGHPVAQGDNPSEAVGVTLPGYFATMRIPLLAGRDFTRADTAKGEPVAIVNQAFARKYFPGVNALGRHIQADVGDGVVASGIPRRIVGIAGDVKQRGLTVEPVPQYFLPWTQAVINIPYLCLRTSGNPAALENAMRATVANLDPNLPLYLVNPLDDYVAQSAAQSRFQALLLSSFAVMALLLGAVGLYGVLSYIVEQRSGELALRLAVGARRGDVLQMILRRGLVLALVGEAAGLIMAFSLTRSIAALLYGVKPLDTLTFASVALLLLLVALASSFAPAYRAARTDPMSTLREQ